MAGKGAWYMTDRVVDLVPCPPSWRPMLFYTHKRLSSLDPSVIHVIEQRCGILKNPSDETPFIPGISTVISIACGAFVFVLLLTLVYCRCRYNSTRKLIQNSDSFTSETELTPGGKTNEQEEGDNLAYTEISTEEQSKNEDNQNHVFKTKKEMYADSEILDTIGVKAFSGYETFQTGNCCK